MYTVLNNILSTYPSIIDVAVISVSFYVIAYATMIVCSFVGKK